MKTKLFTFLAVFGIMIAGTASASLWSYYNDQGLELPPVSERVADATRCGIDDYIGTYDQNTALEECMTGHSSILGAISRPELFYDENLTGALARGGSETEIYVSALPNETTGYLIINPTSASSRELIKYTGVTTTGGNQVTGVTRGLAEYGTTGTVISDASVSANIKRHSSGERIIMSNGRYEQHIIDVLNGLAGTGSNTFIVSEGTNTDKYITFDTDEASGYDPGVKYTSSTNQLGFRRYGESTYREIPLSLRGTYDDYASLPTTDNSSGDIAITTDDYKLYTYNASSTVWVLAGGSSGAGTVYKTELLGSEATGGDNRTFTLTSGSFPDEKFLQVFRNGVFMRQGASYDYTASTSLNSIEFNYDVNDTDTIGMYVVSIDLYNANWANVSEDLLPDTDATHDIGSSSLQFKDIYFSGDLYQNGVQASSTPTVSAIPMNTATGTLKGGWVGATTTGAITYQGADETLQGLPIGTAGQVLSVNSGATAPEWGLSFATGQTTRASAAGVGTTTISHGLGRVPNGVIIKAYRLTENGATDSISESYGTATGTDDESCSYMSWNLATGNNNSIGQSNGNIINLTIGSGSGVAVASLTTLDATNIILTFSTFSDTGGDLIIQWSTF